MTSHQAETAAPVRDIALMIALCPLIAASDTVVNAIALGLATILASMTISVVLLVLHHRLDDTMRLAATLLVSAMTLALIERALLAYFHELRQSLGAFLPLLAVNAALIRSWQAEEQPGSRALVQSLRIGVSITAVLVLLGIARELVGRGSLLHDAGLMFGVWFARLELIVFRVDMGFLLAMLPPGAFIAFGLLLALRNWLWAKSRTP